MTIRSVRSIRAVALLVVVAAALAGSAAGGLALVPARVAEAQTCDASLWKRVYNPTRLTKVNACITATGTITESSADPDGDQHFLLKLDKGQKALLNKRNKKKKDESLVVEIVCANPVRLRKVKGICDGYRNSVMIPPVGAHVKVTGSYVIDTHNGWAEIHPASGIDLIK
jgi:hypothetical protein